MIEGWPCRSVRARTSLDRHATSIIAPTSPEPPDKQRPPASRSPGCRSARRKARLNPGITDRDIKTLTSRRSGRLQDGFPRRRWPSISGWSAWRRACGRRGSSTHVCRFGRIFAACSASSGAAILRLLGRDKTGKAAVEGGEFFVDAHQPPLGGSGDGRIPGSVICSQRLHTTGTWCCWYAPFFSWRPDGHPSCLRGVPAQKACPEVFLCGQSRVRVFA
jgi:hypothetical protein